jgi:predicted small lipoprotein YifL
MCRLFSCFFTYFALLITLTALGACGTRGGLYLPPPDKSSPAAGKTNVQTPALPANPNTTKDPD